MNTSSSLLETLTVFIILVFFGAVMGAASGEPECSCRRPS